MDSEKGSKMKPQRNAFVKKLDWMRKAFVKKTGRRVRAQSNPRKQEVIPATDFEYFQYFVMLKKVASSEDKMKINSELLLSCKLIF